MTEPTSEWIYPDQAAAPYYGVECVCGHFNFIGPVPVPIDQPVFHALQKQVGCKKCGTILLIEPSNVRWTYTDPNHRFRSSLFYHRLMWCLNHAKLHAILYYWTIRFAIRWVLWKLVVWVGTVLLWVIEIIEWALHKLSEKLKD